MQINKTIPILNNKTKLVILASIGSLLEYYDFIIYILLANYIADNFFPTKNHVISLMLTFATFSLGYLIRPLGGLLFGHFGDKVGRKKTFTFVIFMMSVSTFAIGITPSYQTIGLMAPIILTILRLLQGFSVGGEIPGTITYLGESMSKHIGLIGGIIFFFLVSGHTAGLALNALLHKFLSQHSISIWGWRIPFIVGGFLGGISYLIRKQCYESPIFINIGKNVEKFPFLTLIKNKSNVKSLIAGFLLSAFAASITSMLFMFTPAYLGKILHYDVHIIFPIMTICVAISSILSILMGYLSDHISNQKALITVVSFASILLSYVIFNMFVHKQVSLWIPFLISAILHGCTLGILSPILVKIFPAKIRYSGMAASYNTALALFGGLTPFIGMLLIKNTHLLQSPSYFLFFTSLLGAISVFFFRNDIA